MSTFSVAPISSSPLYLSSETLSHTVLLEPVSMIDARASYKGEIIVDSKYIYIESKFNHLQVWNKETLTLECSFDFTNDAFTIIGTSGTHLWVYAADGLSADLLLLNLTNGTLTKKIGTYGYFAVDDRYLIQSHYQWNKETGSTETQAKIWNVTNGEWICSLDNFGSHSYGLHPKSLSCAPVFQGDYVITGHKNGGVNMWSKHDGCLIRNLAVRVENECNTKINSLIVDEDRIFWGDDNGAIYSSKISEEGRFQTYAHPSSCALPVGKLEVSDDLLIGLFRGERSHISVWQKDTGNFLYSIEYHQGKTLIKGDRFILYKADENLIQTYNKRDGSLLISISDLPPKCWDFKIVENLLVIPNVDGLLQVRNLENGTLISVVNASQSYFTIDNHFLFAHSLGTNTEVLKYDLSPLL